MNESIAECPYCNGKYSFYKYDEPCYVNCPYCGNENVISDKDWEIKKEFSFKQLFFYLILIGVFSVLILYNSGFLTFDNQIIPNEHIENSKGFMDGVGYGLKDTRKPTQDELFQMEESLDLVHNTEYTKIVSFVENNDLDEYIYDDWFDCDEYSYELIDSARQKKMRCGYVVIYPTEEEYYDWTDEEETNEYLENPPHAIVVFRTKGKGNTFVEPQLDVVWTEEEFNEMQSTGRYYAEDDSYFDISYFLEMDFNHYTIDWFWWYEPDCISIDCVSHNLPSLWNIYKEDYPNFDDDYSKYLLGDV